MYLYPLVYAIFLTFAIFAGFASHAQSGSAPLLSLQSALDTALKNYPAIRAKAAGKSVAATEVTITRTNYIPDLILQGQATYGTSNQVRGVFFPNEGTAIPVAGGIKTNGTNTNDMVWSSFATALVNWKVFNFGKWKAKTDLARAEVNKAQSDYDNEVFQHQVKVCDAYILVILLEDIVRSKQANLSRVEALKKVTAAYAQSGLKSGVDSSLINAEYASAYLQLLESQRIAEEQKINLMEMMGWDTAPTVKLDTSVYLTKTPQSTGWPDKVQNSPLLNYYQSVIDYNYSKIKAIKRSELPSVSILGATFGRGSGIADQLNPNGGFVYDKSLNGGLSFRAYDFMVGISAIWNITRSYRSQLEGEQQSFITQQTEQQYNEQKLKLEGELNKAHLRFKASMEAARQAPVQLKAARDAYSQSKARYDSGLTTIVELTQTFAILNRAEVDLTMANGNTWRSLLTIAAASGDLNLFLQNVK